ncbi:MAG TPA: bifunctional UDP-N-acetylmuramoyl-tripeptide:D-alanyl-D-alanine ligase/alanine racemase, partial [Cytophagales bacterium]|nr:bifunctional UDP-N-acetylmuramoyl-tripeptide:D-alanyl-D-alanine ligase/alanine racemase [Cytophagales bacterium]
MTTQDLTTVFQVPVQGLISQPLEIRRWMIDSREQVPTEGTVFFALVGDRHNGHAYLADLYARGIRAFVVGQPLAQAEFPEAVWWQVPDTRHALQLLAGTYRSQFHYPVVGITGSNGKTIVKEWLSQLAGSAYAV